MDIVVVGHVDHGKSTVVGRLLADTRSLPDGKLEQVRANCERNSKPFEYAFLLDALKDEQSQGITIDAARMFFRTPARHYTIIDAPGHIEFLKNMVTGASRAEAALLVIDAKEGVRENSRRHGYLLSMLGVTQVAVLVNKMDLLGYDQAGFEKVKAEYLAFLSELGVTPTEFIPISGYFGQNLVEKAAEMPWYRGRTVIQALDSFRSEAAPSEKPFRMPVQDVYKFTRGGDDRRIICGSVESGKIRPGQEVVFYPSGKKARVKAIEAFNCPTLGQAVAPEATGFTLTEQIYVSRGELAAISGEPPPQVATRLRVSLFWLGKKPMTLHRPYTLKLGTARVEVKLLEVLRVMDTATLQTTEKGEQIGTNAVAECVLELQRPVAADLSSDHPGTGRFVIVDDFDIAGGGLVREALQDQQSRLRDKVILRNSKWETSLIPREARAERYRQKAALVLITSEKTIERKTLGKMLEAELFAGGRFVYFIGMANTIYGVGADIVVRSESSDEVFRRFAELVNVLLDAGVIVVATVAELNQDSLEIIRTTVDSDRIYTVWIGESVTTDLQCDLQVTATSPNEGVQLIQGMLQEKGLILKPL